MSDIQQSDDTEVSDNLLKLRLRRGKRSAQHLRLVEGAFNRTVNEVEIMPLPPKNDLKSYIRITAAAEILGMTRARVARLWKKGAFRSGYIRGPKGSPAFVARVEVIALAKWYRETIPITEAAELVGCDRSTIFRWIKKSQIRGSPDAFGEWRVYLEDIKQYTPATPDTFE